MRVFVEDFKRGGHYAHFTDLSLFNKTAFSNAPTNDDLGDPMKKSLLALAVLSTFASASRAQSSVTLYGVVDAGYAYTNNSGGQKLYEAIGAGSLQGDRWGLLGKEDLGAGLKALFLLENGFNAFSGKLAQGDDEFGRQAYVGLSGQFGTVTLGRQYDSVVDYTGAFAVGLQWGSSYGAHPGDLDNMHATNRVNNSIKYASTNYSGVTFGALYSLGGVAGQFNRNQIFSGGVGYAQGPFSLGAGYLSVKNPNFSFFGNNSASSATASNMTGSTVYSGYATARKQQVVSAAGAYTFGPTTVGATYSNTQFKDLGLTPVTTGGQTTVGSAKFHNVELNFKYQLTPALLLGVAYDYTKGYGINDAKYHQGILGMDYFLSKSTDLYFDGIYQHALGTDSTGHSAVADVNGLSPSSTSNQVAVLIGIRHKF